MSGEFSVCQFFADADDTHEYVRRHVDGKEAVEAFKHYTSSVGVKVGLVNRVIVTDGDDNIALEWRAAERVR
jgi:hypothetical protein